MTSATASESEQEILEFVFSYLLVEDGGHENISGKRLRASLSSLNAGNADVDSLLARGWLVRDGLGVAPNDFYKLSGIGFVRSSNRIIFLRYGQAVLGYLKERFARDPDFDEYTWDELRSSLAVQGQPLGDGQFQAIHHAIKVAWLFCGSGGSFSGGNVAGYTWGAPSDIEQLVEVPNFSARLRSLYASDDSKTLAENSIQHVPSPVAHRTAVVLTALPLERNAVLSQLGPPRRDTHPLGTIYEVADLSGTDWRVAVASIGIGNDKAAAETERASAHFNPDVLMFVGVAGGLKDVRLGDVVASTKIYGFEYGKDAEAFHPRPEVGKSSYRLEQLARAEGGTGKWSRSDPHGRPPKAHVGPIAAGSRVVSDSTSPSAVLLKENFSDALAVEMEGLGFLAATHMGWGAEAIVVRGISDLLDGKTESDAVGWQERAAENAAGFALHLLTAFEYRSARKRQEAQAAPLPPVSAQERTPAAANHSSQRSSSTRFFDQRMAKAFPGVRGLVEHIGDDARKRLSILFSDLGCAPDPRVSADLVWWFRGGLSSEIQVYQNLQDGVSLLNRDEVQVRRIWAYRDEAHWRNFLYLEWGALPSILTPPTGAETIARQASQFGYATDEYAIWGKHIISRTEYDDCAAVIDGEVVEDVSGAELRGRHLAPFNVVVAGKDSPFNDAIPEVLVEEAMSGILEGRERVERLVELISRMPQPRRTE